MRVRASGAARLEQEVGELVEQSLEIERLQHARDVAAIGRVFHRLLTMSRPGLAPRTQCRVAGYRGKALTSRHPMLDRLRSALAGRYTIERELGAGGMATVYLAKAVSNPRRVAVTVRRPEIAATLGAERFSREIDVAAQLQHPHILPLLDSGEALGFFYYVFPVVDGQSL